MQLPTCAYCGKIIRHPHPEGNLVVFRMTVAQQNYNKARDVQAQIGHPAGADWFCRRHAVKARKYQHMTLGEAMRAMQENQSFWEKMMHVIYKMIIIRR